MRRKILRIDKFLRTLFQVRKNLLKKEKSSSIKEIQRLAAVYPELISLQEVNKKKKLGANAMYYAITLGKFELVSWLTKQSY